MSTHFQGQNVSNYHQGPLRQVPGYESLLKMTSMLLSEKIGTEGDILVLGAGGGLEIRAMAEAHAGWRFEGIDPSQDMIDLASTTIEHYRDRVELRTGYIQSASQKLFDGATCILTMHFVPQNQRLETLREIRERLKPGAAYVQANISFPQTEPERSEWIARHVDFAGTAPENRDASIEAIGTRLTILAPDEEEALMNEAGFGNITRFYQGISFMGWVAYAR